MKSENQITKIVMWVLFAGIAAYFALYAYHVLFRSYETAALYTYQAEDIVEGNGYLFRSESVLSGGSSLEEVVVGEGENVAKGDVIAVSYQDQEALSRSRELTALEKRMDALSYILGHAADSADSTALNQNITDAITGIRYVAAGKDLTALPDKADTLKKLMFRRDYTYNGSSALSDEIRSISKDIDKLRKENQSTTKKVVAGVSGVFSGVVDGYEQIMKPDDVLGMTVSDLHTLANREVTVPSSLGKIVTEATWYCAVEMTKENAKRLREDSQVTLRFNGMERKIPMTVRTISDVENGRVCVVLSGNRYLSEVTMLRNQTVDIIYGTASGYRVSKSAIYVDSGTGHPGVYRVFGTQARWVEVDLLWEGEDFYLIRQTPQYDKDGNELEMTSLEAARQLRAGAEIVVSGRDLYDGKVLK